MTVVTPRCFQRRRTITLCSHNRGKVQHHQHILGFFDVEIDSKVDAVVQETEVETNVPLFLAFPFDVLVGNLCRTVGDTQVRLHLAQGNAPLESTDVGVTSLTPAETQLTIADDVAKSLLEELLVRETP